MGVLCPPPSQAAAVAVAFLSLKLASTGCSDVSSAANSFHSSCFHPRRSPSSCDGGSARWRRRSSSCGNKGLGLGFSEFCRQTQEPKSSRMMREDDGVAKILAAAAGGGAARQATYVAETHEADELGTTSNKDLCSTTRGLCDTVIGVLGGGQLGRMLCEAASPMGIRVSILDPSQECPAARIAYRHVLGSFQDMVAVQQFAQGCGALTVEIEHVDVETLEALARKGFDVEPTPFTIRVIQDKYLQKMHFKQHGVALPDFMKVDSLESAEEAGRVLGYPFMLKSRRLAYDGRGNSAVKSKDELLKAVASLGGFERGLYVEKWAPFIKELAVMVARGRDGCIKSFPVVETTHKDNICHTVEAPAQIPTEIASIAMEVAERAVGSLTGAGVFGVELFLLKDGEVLLNEVAPRPHNSGHYTIEACYVSQYEQHLRAVLGLPLGDPSMKVPASLMFNLLGEAEGDEGFTLAHHTMRRAMAVSGASVHWYEKPEIRKQRKMGHITVVGETIDICRARINWIINGEGSNSMPI